MVLSRRAAARTSPKAYFARTTHMEGSEDPSAGTPGAGGAAGGAAEPSEEEMRAQLEEQMRKVRVQDLVLQSVAGLINLTARRIAKEDERDLEQAKIGIDAVRALVDLLEPEARGQVQNALSELQMLFAQQSRGQAGDQPSEGGGSGPEPSSPGGQAPPGERPGSAPGGGESGRPSRLWTPPGTSSS